MPKEILRLKQDQVRKMVKQGKIGLDNGPTNFSPTGNKPEDTAIPTETPVNTLGKISTNRISRREFLVGGALVLGGLTLSGIGFKTVEYLNSTPEKILRTSFRTEELPQGWYQEGSHGVDSLDTPYAGKVLSTTIFLRKAGKPSLASSMVFWDCLSSENAQAGFKGWRKDDYPNTRLIDGIGDMASLSFNTNGPWRYFIVVNKMLVYIDGGELDNLAKSSIKYLNRIGVTVK